MGMMVDGQWQRDDLRSAGANFVRPQTVFRSWVTEDGRPGPSGEGGFKAERGRYHLYVSLACPWAHRTAIFRKLKGLEDVISMTEVEPVMGDQGWTTRSPYRWSIRSWAMTDGPSARRTGRSRPVQRTTI
jgi:putative glutathione S-transferase